MKLTITIGGTDHRLEFDPAGTPLCQLDGEQFTATVAAIAPGWYSILMGDRSFAARVSAATASDDRASVRVNLDGRVVAVSFKDPRRWSRGGSAAQLSGSQQVAAPMPGKVVCVLVSPGLHVAAGQGLIVVEAMKMQNEIKSPKAGTVQSISVREGQTVAAGEALMIIE